MGLVGAGGVVAIGDALRRVGAAIAPALGAGALLVVAAPAAATTVARPVSVADQTAHTLAVGFREGTAPAREAALLRAARGTVLRHLGERDSVHVWVHGPLGTAARVLRRARAVKYADRVRSTRLAATPDAEASADFAQQWSLHNVGQFTGSTPGSDIDAKAAWALAGSGSADVLLASVDSGVAFSVPALAGLHLWDNPGEAGGVAGVDDDATFCVDDVVGCDFVNDDADPSDDDGHGTATVSMMLGPWGSSPIAGLAPGVSLITAKVLDATGSGTTAELAAGLNYVAEQGAAVVTVSITGPDSAAVEDAMADHPATLFVVAAGNDGDDVEGGSTSYPCESTLPNVVCVAASTWSDGLASFSNYGATSVDLAAPGNQVDGLGLTGTLESWKGTSFAAPLVSATAALGLSLVPSAPPAQIVAALRSGADPLAAFASTTAFGGRLDSARTLEALSGRPAPAVPATGRARIRTVHRDGARRLRVTVACAGTVPCAGSLAVATGSGSGPATSFSVPRRERKVVVVRGAGVRGTARLMLRTAGAGVRAVHARVLP